MRQLHAVGGRLTTTKRTFRNPSPAPNCDLRQRQESKGAGNACWGAGVEMDNVKQDSPNADMVTAVVWDGGNSEVDGGQ